MTSSQLEASDSDADADADDVYVVYSTKSRDQLIIPKRTLSSAALRMSPFHAFCRHYRHHHHHFWPSYTVIISQSQSSQSTWPKWFIFIAMRWSFVAELKMRFIT